MKIPNLRLLIIGLITCISVTCIGQIKYVRLTINQPNVEECITDIENTFRNSDFKIFPNPSQGVFTLEINRLSHKKNIGLSVSDISGREIIKEDLRITEDYKKTLDLSQFGKGTYIIHIVGGPKAFFRAKLIVY